MGKTLFCIMIGGTEAVNVMGNLVDKNAIEVKVSKVVDVSVAEAERVCAEKDTFSPVNAVATNRTLPRLFLFACAGEEKNSAQIH